MSPFCLSVRRLSSQPIPLPLSTSLSSRFSHYSRYLDIIAYIHTCRMCHSNSGQLHREGRRSENARALLTFAGVVARDRGRGDAPRGRPSRGRRRSTDEEHSITEMNCTKLGLSTLRMLCSRAPTTHPPFQFAVSTLVVWLLRLASVLLDAFFYSGHPSLWPPEAAASAVSFCRYCFIPVQSVVGLFQLLFFLSPSVALPLLVDVLVPGGAVNGTRGRRERERATTVAARAGGGQAGHASN